MQKETMKPRNLRIEMTAIVVGLVAVFVWLTGCTADVLTRSDACHEQAAVWCEQIGHSNEACETGAYYRCAPNPATREDVVDPEPYDRCIESMICAVSETKTTLPPECPRTWY